MWINIKDKLPEKGYCWAYGQIEEEWKYKRGLVKENPSEFQSYICFYDGNEFSIDDHCCSSIMCFVKWYIPIETPEDPQSSTVDKMETDEK